MTIPKVTDNPTIRPGDRCRAEWATSVEPTNLELALLLVTMSWTDRASLGRRCGQAVLTDAHNREPEHHRHFCEQHRLGELDDLVFVRR